MQPQEFCYWLQGFAELNGSKPTTQQWEMIKEHLNLVFNKVTVLENKKIDNHFSYLYTGYLPLETGITFSGGSAYKPSDNVFYTC